MSEEICWIERGGGCGEEIRQRGEQVWLDFTGAFFFRKTTAIVLVTIFL